MLRKMQRDLRRYDDDGFLLLFQRLRVDEQRGHRQLGKVRTPAPLSEKKTSQRPAAGTARPSTASRPTPSASTTARPRRPTFNTSASASTAASTGRCCPRRSPRRRSRRRRRPTCPRAPGTRSRSSPSWAASSCCFWGTGGAACASGPARPSPTCPSRPCTTTARRSCEAPG